MGDPPVYLTRRRAGRQHHQRLPQPDQLPELRQPVGMDLQNHPRDHRPRSVAEATQWLAGDWSAIWKFGDAMGNLAQFMQELGIEIEQGMLTLDHSWHGNAEDAAYMYFSDLAATVSGQEAAMFNAQDSYHLAAKGAWQFANQLANLLQSIADEAVIAAMTMAASTGAATTGIGAAVGILGYAGSALLVARILDKVNQASQIINYSGMAIMGMFGLVSDAAAQTGHLSNVPLPVSGFSLPAAAS